MEGPAAVGPGRREPTPWRRASLLAVLGAMTLGACEDFPLGLCDPGRLGSAPNIGEISPQDLAIAVTDARTRFLPRLGSEAIIAPLDSAMAKLGSALNAGDMPGACLAYNEALEHYQAAAPNIQVDSTLIMEIEVLRLTLGVVEGSLLSLIRG